MRIGMRLASATFMTVVATAQALANGALTAEQWREDLDYLVAQLHDIHLNLFHTIDEGSFNDAVAALRADIPPLDDETIALRLSRLAALIGDGHTWLSPYDDETARLPIEVYPFADGLFITHAMPPHEALRGAEVVRIGDASTARVVEAARDYVSGDNAYTRLGRVPRVIVSPTFLRLEGFAEGTPTLSLKTSDGASKDVDLSPVTRKDFAEWIESLPKPEDAPLFLRRQEEAYWREHLAEHDTMYMRFNSVQNLEDGPHLAAFSRGLVKAINDTESDFLIVDARYNGGGNGNLTVPLIRRIAEHSRINREGHLYLITNRHTFSAALMLTVRMERATEVLFAGEPGGGKPNSYSEHNEVFLPNSKLEGSVSSLFHEEGEPDDAREYVDVDFPVPYTSRDYLDGRDPVLERLLAEIDGRRK